MALKYLIFLTILNNLNFSNALDNSFPDGMIIKVFDNNWLSSKYALSNYFLKDDVYCNVTTGEKEHVDCLPSRMNCGQCIFYMDCDVSVGKWKIESCPKKRYIYNSTVDNRALWMNQYFDPVTKQCLDYVRSSIKGKCHTYQECRIILTDEQINPIIWRIDRVTEHKCPSNAFTFDPVSLECVEKTNSQCGNLFCFLSMGESFCLKVFELLL